MKYKKSVKRMKTKLKAMTILEVLKETGKFNLAESHRRFYPNQKPENAHFKAKRCMWTPEVYDEFVRLLRADKETCKKFGAEDLVADILGDLKKIEIMLENPELKSEEMSKLINAKSTKQKLLGSYLGIWNADKPQENTESDPDEIFKSSRFGVGVN